MLIVLNYVNENSPTVKSYVTSQKYKNKINFIMFLLMLLPLAAFLISIICGRYAISLGDFTNIIISKVTGNSSNITGNADIVLFKVRLPRIIAAMIVGASLSVSGATYQGMFKNPMVSPDILGATAGAGFGAAMGILMSFSTIQIQCMSFAIGLLAVAISYFICKIISKGEETILILVLTGMVVSTLFQSFISLTKYVADPYSKMPAITFWLMGGLSTINMDDVKMLIVPFLLGAVPLFLIRWKINSLSFGEEEAKALGIDTSKLRLLIVLCSTLMTAVCVAVSGMVGWVGLIIPHVARMIVGPNFKVLLPASLLIGSSYLLLIDDLARSLFSVEIPLGILTSIIGAPFFIYLLLKGKKGWA